MVRILTWRELIANEKKQLYFIKILNRIAAERRAGITIYPSKNDIFNAFRLTELHDIKVVILGQDPYHGPGQAHGLAFSVQKNVSLPPSLRNIYRELKRSIPSFNFPKHGCLETWARQGVMLLNTILTVRAGQAFSHYNIGWQVFTNKIIRIINDYCDSVVILLWGAHAQKKEVILNKNRHFILKASHPSPISAHYSFFGCNHFILANQWLKQHGKEPINWKSL